MYSTVAAIGSESKAFRVMKGAVMRSEVEEGNGMREKKDERRHMLNEKKDEGSDVLLSTVRVFFFFNSQILDWMLIGKG